jgi:hypothetical protein
LVAKDGRSIVKRTALLILLLLGGAAAAQADNDIYNNTLNPEAAA